MLAFIIYCEPLHFIYCISLAFANAQNSRPARIVNTKIKNPRQKASNVAVALTYSYLNVSHCHDIFLPHA